MGIEKLEEYSRHFGLEEKTGVELPGEVVRNIGRKNIIREAWNDMELWKYIVCGYSDKQRIVLQCFS
jgi:cell division protein FtsI/penicillin-binding protein 2